MDSNNQYLSASINETYCKQFGRQVSASGGVMPYYPSNPSPGGSRPRSFSAGSSQPATSVKKTGTSGTAIKVIRVGSASKAYTKAAAKSPDDTKGGGGLSRYKTELCRPFQDYGYCKYGDKCQFAHGEHELRVVPRHPKYKTELCRTYHTRGFCPYGSRCHFIHTLEEARKNAQDGGSSVNGVPPHSPTKKTLGFNLPISPSLDSGISSPDDILGYGRRFEFPPAGSLEPSSGSSGSGSDEDLDQSAFYDEVPSLPFFEGGEGVSLEQGSSPDPFMEFDDVHSTGSVSPTKPVSDVFVSSGPDLSELLGRMNLAEQPPPPSPKSAHRLPVFDDMLNSRSDTALLNGFYPFQQTH